MAINGNLKILLNKVLIVFDALIGRGAYLNESLT